MTYFERKRIKKTVSHIEQLKKDITNKRIIDVRVPLEKLKCNILSGNHKYSRKTFKEVERHLDNMNKHLDTSYTAYLKNESSKACDAVNGIKLDLTKGEMLIVENEDRIASLKYKLKQLKSGMEQAENEMDTYLGKDEISWKIAHNRYQSLSNKYLCYSKTLNDILKHTDNLRMAEDARNIQHEFTDTICNEQIYVDVDEFNEHLEASKYAGEETSSQNEAMTSAIHESFEDDDDAYRRALEAKILSSKVDTPSLEASSSKESI